MLYEDDIRNAVLDALNDRASSIVLSIGKLLEEGYLPSKRKKYLLSMAIILINVYENIDLFTEEQQDKLDEIVNSIITL